MSTLEADDLLIGPDEWSASLLEDLTFDTTEATVQATVESSSPALTCVKRYIEARHDCLLRRIRTEVSSSRYETILMTLSVYGSGVISEAVAEVFIRNALSSHQSLHEEFCILMRDKHIYDVVQKSYDAVVSDASKLPSAESL